MNNLERSAANHASYLYSLKELKRGSGSSMFRHTLGWHTLLWFRQGQGGIMIDGKRYALSRKKWFVLGPQAIVQLHLLDEIGQDWLALQFELLEEVAPRQYAPAEWTDPVELLYPQEHLFQQQLEQLESRLVSSFALDAMKANLLFQELIYDLLQQQSNEKLENGLDHAISRTIDYMNKNYMKRISRDQLAELAGVSADYYTRSFKNKVGMSPIEYLNEVRMNQAKQLLLQSNESFRSIAQHVGFTDEFYFSRKFKATGYSPTAYIKHMRSSGRIASLKHLPTGHFMALQLAPYAAVMNNSFPIRGRMRDTVSVGVTGPDLERLYSVKPELIVTCSSREAECSRKDKLLQQIAPTVALPFFQSWRDHFQTIARIVGKEQEADQWLDQYDSKADRLSKQLRRKIGQQTLLVVGVGNGKLCIYGRRNIGTVLYDDLSFIAPRGVQEIVHYQEISIELLKFYEADRIVITAFKHDGTPQMEEAVRREIQLLWKRTEWRELKAVRQGNVSYLLEGKHLYTSYNPLSHGLLLDLLEQELLLSESSKQWT
ncbi:AraC family transcriptional regulator [Paenibacillus turpanensis]|uniref:AraC family transcriptional regulator n=1 Tax=Paenibacillus turpanensis TaxID=2689078 RepID=UPI00140A54FF|nr:AraC family transcriptional regulator [Paenibacillus turpanensis]